MSSRKKTNSFSPARENPPDVEALVAFGKQYPKTPGLTCIPRVLAASATRVPIRYSTNVTMTSTSGAIVSFLVSGNGLFNPDTGAGQPLGFDQWMALYLRYRCIASSIEVSLANVGTTNPSANGDIVIYPSLHGSGLSTLTAASSQPYVTRRTGNFAYNMNGGKPLKSHMSTSVIHGVSKQTVLADDTYSGDSAANPTRGWNWIVSLESADGTTTSVYYVEITVTYLVDFYNLDLITQSMSVPKSISVCSALTASSSKGNPESLSASVTEKLKTFLERREPSSKQDDKNPNATLQILEERLAAMRR